MGEAKCEASQRFKVKKPGEWSIAMLVQIMERPAALLGARKGKHGMNGR
jgi:hypothetical protein